MGEYLSKTKEYIRTQVDLGERTRQKYIKVAERYFKSNEHLTVEAANRFISATVEKSRSYYVRYAFKYIFAAIGRPNEYNDLIEVKEKEAAPKAVYMNNKKLVMMINAIQTKRHKIVAIIQYCTGIRASEAFGIRKKYILYDKGVLSLKLKQKGGDERLVFINNPYAKQVYAFLEASKNNFPLLRDAVRLNDKNFEKIIDSNYHAYWLELRKAAAKLGHKGFSTHDFRRNFINDVYKKTKDLVVVKLSAGHKDIDTTMRYINKQTDPEKLKKITKEVRGE